MVFKNLCVIVLWMKVALALEGLKRMDPSFLASSKELPQACILRYLVNDCEKIVSRRVKEGKGHGSNVVTNVIRLFEMSMEKTI